MGITRHAGSRLQTPFYLRGEPATSAGVRPDGAGGCWEPVGCLSLLLPFWDPLPGSPLVVFYAAKLLLWGVTDFTLHQTLFPAFSLQTHLVSGIQVPLENSCFISLDMNNLLQSLLWLAGI